MTDNFVCCDYPQPRVSEITGRFFCFTCHRILGPQEPAQDTAPTESTDDPREKEVVQEDA